MVGRRQYCGLKALTRNLNQSSRKFYPLILSVCHRHRRTKEEKIYVDTDPITQEATTESLWLYHFTSVEFLFYPYHLHFINVRPSSISKQIIDCYHWPSRANFYHQVHPTSLPTGKHVKRNSRLLTQQQPERT